MCENGILKEKEALKFLGNDFNQCFQQMRHHDNQIFNILKFMFTAYTALAGAALALYQFGIKESKDLSLPAIAALIIGLLIGLFMFSMVIRNRAYYVKVARYINEQREFFLNIKPMGYINHTDMYMGGSRPKYFNMFGTQAWFTYLIAFLNSSLLGVLLFIQFASNVNRWQYIIGCVVSLFLAQIIIACLYLISKEPNKK